MPPAGRLVYGVAGDAVGGSVEGRLSGPVVERRPARGERYRDGVRQAEVTQNADGDGRRAAVPQLNIGAIRAPLAIVDVADLEGWR
jgi:hypothetical protein